jgi:probable HAF family extracellular repeat protein
MNAAKLRGTRTRGATPNASGFPTVQPFVWEYGKMLDIGSFGGTFCITGCVNWLNNRGQAVGGSDLPGDTTEHPFLWSEDEGMKDLGTLGGIFGAALWVNEDGKVVGAATTEGDLASLAFLWVEGHMTNFGALAGDACSIGINFNSHNQVVGSSVPAADCGSDSGRAFLWEGGDLIDLNIFVPTRSGLTLTQGAFINDRGEILATGVLADGDIRSVLLIPCDENHPGIEDCDYSLVDPAAAAQWLAQTNNKVPEMFRHRLSARRFVGRRP